MIKKAAQDQDGCNLYRQVHGDVNLYACILELCKTFKSIELIEKYGNYMRIRVARLGYSIGFVFGLVEDMRKEFDVSEYSVS